MEDMHTPTSSIIEDAQQRIREGDGFTMPIMMDVESLNEVDRLLQAIRKLEELDVALFAFNADEAEYVLDDALATVHETIEDRVTHYRVLLDMATRGLLSSMMPA